MQYVTPLSSQTLKSFFAAPPQVLDLDSVIHTYVRYVLELNHGNKQKTARQLRISRSTLYRLLEHEQALPM